MVAPLLLGGLLTGASMFGRQQREKSDRADLAQSLNQYAQLLAPNTFSDQPQNQLSLLKERPITNLLQAAQTDPLAFKQVRDLAGLKTQENLGLNDLLNKKGSANLPASLQELAKLEELKELHGTDSVQYQTAYNLFMPSAGQGRDDRLKFQDLLTDTKGMFGENSPQYRSEERAYAEFLNNSYGRKNLVFKKITADRNRINERQKKLDTERVLVNDYNLIRNLLLKGGFETGLGSEIGLNVKRLLNTLQILPEKDIDNLGAQEAFNALTKKVIPNLRVEGSGQQSNFETAFLVIAAPGLRNTKYGNLLLTSGVIETYNYNRDRLNAQKEWLKQHNSLDNKNYEGLSFDEWADKNLESVFDRMQIVQMDRDEIEALETDEQKEAYIQKMNLKKGQIVVFKRGEGKDIKFEEFDIFEGY